MTLREFCQEWKSHRIFVGANTSFFMIGTGDFILSIPEMEPYMDKEVVSTHKRYDKAGINCIVNMDGAAKYWDLQDWEKDFKDKPEEFQKYLAGLPKMLKPDSERKRKKR